VVPALTGLAADKGELGLPASGGARARYASAMERSADLA
jgi:hypothetical protein